MVGGKTKQNKNSAIESCALTTVKSKVQRLDTAIANMTAESLKFWLIKFVQEMCKQNGERHPSRSLYSIVWKTTLSYFCQLIFISKFMMMYCLICPYQITVLIFSHLHLTTIINIVQKLIYFVCNLLKEHQICTHHLHLLSVAVLVINVHKSRAVSLQLIKHRLLMWSVSSAHKTPHTNNEKDGCKFTASAVL